MYLEIYKQDLKCIGLRLRMYWAKIENAKK
jgi:hypothetical protein